MKNSGKAVGILGILTSWDAQVVKVWHIEFSPCLHDLWCSPRFTKSHLEGMSASLQEWRNELPSSVKCLTQGGQLSSLTFECFGNLTFPSPSWHALELYSHRPVTMLQYNNPLKTLLVYDWPCTHESLMCSTSLWQNEDGMIVLYRALL